MLKNVTGLFPPEMAVSSGLVKLLSGLGYEWMAVDETAIPEDELRSEQTTVYELEGSKTKLVARDHELSNMLSFKRDLNTENIVERLLKLRQEGKNAVNTKALITGFTFHFQFPKIISNDDGLLTMLFYYLLR